MIAVHYYLPTNVMRCSVVVLCMYVWDILPSDEEPLDVFSMC